MTRNYDTKFPQGDGAKKLEITEEIAAEIRAGLRAAGQSDLEAEASARAAPVWNLPASAVPTAKRQATLELTSNTAGAIRVMGTDGIVRYFTFTLIP